MATDSPWLTLPACCDYLSGGARTEQGRRVYSPRFLAREVARGRLRAAKVGARGQLLTRREWLDAYVEDLATPIVVCTRFPEAIDLRDADAVRRFTRFVQGTDVLIELLVVDTYAGSMAGRSLWENGSA